jgi:uncharacterized protein (DUF433 family)
MSVFMRISARSSAGSFEIDRVYIVNEYPTMATVVQSCRLEKTAADLLKKQARRRQMEVSTLSSIYLAEKAREEEFPGIGFRDSIAGREAYLTGTRLGVWEVVENYRESKSITATADYYSWPEHRVKCALAYARAFPEEIAAQRKAEIGE